MKIIDENQKIQKITDLLVNGGTMLSNHHECGAPMFRYRGKVLCPVCDIGREEIENVRMSEKAEAAEAVTNITKGKDVSSAVDFEQVEKIPSRIIPAHPYREIEKHIQNKVFSISGSIEYETDLQRVKEKLECIRLGVMILKLLKE